MSDFDYKVESLNTEFGRGMQIRQGDRKYQEIRPRDGLVLRVLQEDGKVTGYVHQRMRDDPASRRRYEEIADVLEQEYGVKVDTSQYHRHFAMGESAGDNPWFSINEMHKHSIKGHKFSSDQREGGILAIVLVEVVQIGGLLALLGFNGHNPVIPYLGVGAFVTPGVMYGAFKSKARRRMRDLNWVGDKLRNLYEKRDKRDYALDKLTEQESAKPIRYKWRNFRASMVRESLYKFLNSFPVEFRKDAFRKEIGLYFRGDSMEEVYGFFDDVITTQGQGAEADAKATFDRNIAELRGEMRALNAQMREIHELRFGPDYHRVAVGSERLRDIN